MATHKRVKSYEILAKTPGLSFHPITTPVSLSTSCAEVFGGSDTPPNKTKAEVKDNICELFTECDNHFHSLTICAIHDPLKPPCVCEERQVQYYKRVASSLETSWARPIDPDHVRTIVEATLGARVEAIEKNGGIKNDIKGATDLSTSSPLLGLTMGEQTGSRIPQELWSYVTASCSSCNIKVILFIFSFGSQLTAAAGRKHYEPLLSASRICRRRISIARGRLGFPGLLGLLGLLLA